MLYFDGWLKLVISKEHEDNTDCLLDENFSESHNFEQFFTHNVNSIEGNFLDYLYHTIGNLNVRNTYLEACFAATECDNMVIYRTILPLVVANDWDELETYLLERSLISENQILQEHKSSIQRKILYTHLQTGQDDAPGKL